MDGAAVHPHRLLAENEALRTRVRDLERALSLDNTASLKKTFRLPPVLSKYLSVLLRLPAASTDVLARVVAAECDPKITKYRLQRHLKAWGITINTTRNVGYWLSDEDKAKIRALMADTDIAEEELLNGELAAEPQCSSSWCVEQQQSSSIPAAWDEAELSD